MPNKSLETRIRRQGRGKNSGWKGTGEGGKQDSGEAYLNSRLGEGTRDALADGRQVNGE